MPTTRAPVYGLDYTTTATPTSTLATPTQAPTMASTETGTVTMGESEWNKLTDGIIRGTTEAPEAQAPMQRTTVT